MTTESLLLDRDAVHSKFDEWTAEQESLDAQLSESLSALAAYQSHLDAWQRQLSQERDELRTAREQFECDRAAAGMRQGQSSAEASEELSATREKNAELTTSLLARTEELRTLDQQRAELATELDLVRAREIELKTALDEQQRTLDLERAQSSQELHQLRETLKHRGEAVEPAGQANGASAHSVAEPPRAANSTNRDQSSGGAVLSSIVEQFGKLRLQRAVDRQGLNKAR